MMYSHTLGMSIVALVCLIGLVGVGVVGGVEGEFSSSYDGLNSEATEDPGREIVVEGEIIISGSSSAMEPRITIESTEETVLDTESVEVFVSGDDGGEFDIQYHSDQVVLTTDEMTPDSRVQLRLLVYPVGGQTDESIESAQVTFDYETPGGDAEQDEFTTTTDLSDNPERELSQIEREEEVDETLSMFVRGLAGIGGIAVLGLLGMVGLRTYKRTVGGNGSRRRRKR